MADTVVIDCFPASVARYLDDHAIVAVDVIRATTLAVTAIALGRRCFVASDVADAFAIRDRLGEAVLAGELGGDTPAGFDLNNSPSDLARRGDGGRPLVMLSTSGTDLMLEASRSRVGAYVASLRNARATAVHVSGRHERVALIGAGSRGEFREEDQIGCARVAALLVDAGYRPGDAATTEILERWREAPVSACAAGNSAAYLRRTHQVHDLDFVLEHVDDLELVCVVVGSEIRGLDGAPL